jgi:hypothetical protein
MKKVWKYQKYKIKIKINKNLNIIIVPKIIIKIIDLTVKIVS